MQTLVICPPKMVSASTQQGMTLLELVVVMFIAALVTGIALPYTLNMIQTNQDHAAKSAILDSLNSLSLRAYSQGRGFTLTNQSVTSLLPNFPADWKIEVPKSIDFSLNGLCDGGKVELISPKGEQEVWVVAPPDCRFHPQG